MASRLSGQPGAELPRRIDKPWGHELLWAWGRHYAAKLLHVEAGRRLSLQFHQVKEETLLLLSGRAVVELEEPDGSMRLFEAEAGQVFHVPPGCRHRLAALETCVLMEVSTPELDDLVRLHDDFGRS